MEITINLPDTFAVKARGIDFSLESAALSEAVLVAAVQNGLQQSIADAASAAASVTYEAGRADDAALWKDLPKDAKAKFAMDHAAQIVETGRALMEKRIAAILAGEWTTARATSPGWSDLDAMLVTVADEAMTPTKWKAVIAGWDSLTPAQRRAGKLAWIKADEARLAKVQPIAERRLAEGPVDLSL